MQPESFISGKIGGYVAGAYEWNESSFDFDFDLFLMKANAGKFHFKCCHGKNVNVQWTNIVVFLSRVCVY